MTARFSSTAVGRQASLDLELAPSGSASPATSEAAPGAEDSSWSADLSNNPAADDKPTGDDFSGTEEDTNAVVSPSHVGFLLTRVGATLVALPPALPYVVLVELVLIVTLNTYHQQGEVSTLSRTFDICGSCGALVALVAAPVGLRRVTGTGAGQLAALGAGEARISKRARRDLGRAHAWMSALAVIFVMLGLLTLVTATRVGTRSKLTGRLITESYAIAVFFGGLTFFNFALVFFSWWHTLKSAAALVADAVAETRQLIERCSPSSPEWESEVLPSVLGLCDEALPRLSEGWGDGVGFVFLGFWLCAAG